MGYNRENFNRIKQEYEEKYAAKREAAERRKAEVQASVPGLAALDRQPKRMNQVSNSFFSLAVQARP